MPKFLICVCLFVGCGNDSASPGTPWWVDEVETAETPGDAARSHLTEYPRWEHKYVSDHGSTRTELFLAEEQLEVFVDDFESFRDPDEQEIHTNTTGTWSVDDRGVVRFEWSGNVDERTWAPIPTELATLLRENDPHDRGVWTSTGYLAQDATLTRFHHRFHRIEPGTEHGGANATLELSAKPSELINGAPCAMWIEVDVVIRDNRGEERFEFDCVVEPQDGFHRIRPTDWDADDLHVSDWDSELEARGIRDQYEYGVYANFRDAAFPELWFDSGRPQILVTNGYGETLKRFEPEDHEE